ncbi:MAG: hypothetical protein JXA42_08010 [Anaerolineales bacterium]|nr:hypothetical protein [Anaerolineales bacterium]
MSVETKRREILQMLANGTITAEEAGGLLAQIDDQIAENNHSSGPSEPEPVSGPTEYQDPKPRWFHVSVTEGDQLKVLVKIPFKLAEWGIRLGAKLVPESDYVDWDDLLAQINQLKDETLIEVQDKHDSGHVHIYVS